MIVNIIKEWWNTNFVTDFLHVSSCVPSNNTKAWVQRSEIQDWKRAVLLIKLSSFFFLFFLMRPTCSGNSSSSSDEGFDETWVLLSSCYIHTTKKETTKCYTIRIIPRFSRGYLSSCAKGFCTSVQFIWRAFGMIYLFELKFVWTNCGRIEQNRMQIFSNFSCVRWLFRITIILSGEIH